ncbi:MAG: ABC transporter permease [Desulfotomaculales bacterium]
MNGVELIREAWLAIRGHPLRSLLTVLGTVIGVASVIVMIALGQGARASVAAQIEKMGSNLVMVMPGAAGGPVRGAGGPVSTLTWDDARAIARLPGVVHVAPEQRLNATASWSQQTWVTSVVGTTPDLVAIRDWTLAGGRFFDEEDLRNATMVAVLGQTVADALFPPGVDPVGQTVRLRGMAFRVIGVLAPLGGAFMGGDLDDVVYVPLSTAQIRLAGTSAGLRSITVQAARREAVASVAEQAAQVLRTRHRLAPGQADDFTVRNMSEVLAAAESTAAVMTRLLAGVAAVSLIVGGIGIMNIMLVSVTERTREIGVRMAVGATARAILAQFLVESVVLSLTGGFIGLALGALASRLLTALLGWPTLVSPGALALATLFAAAVGVFFGYYPARRAAELNPADALRFE